MTSSDRAAVASRPNASTDTKNPAMFNDTRVSAFCTTKTAYFCGSQRASQPASPSCRCHLFQLVARLPAIHRPRAWRGAGEECGNALSKFTPSCYPRTRSFTLVSGCASHIMNCHGRAGWHGSCSLPDRTRCGTGIKTISTSLGGTNQ